MLISERIAQALEGSRDAFLSAARESTRARERYASALDELSRLSTAEIDGRLGEERWPGARPTAELEARGLVVPFPERWETAQEARTWALRELRGVTTAAVDGSQIPASKEFGVPVSLVQAAWFENHHDPDRPYVKDVRDELLMADDVAADADQFAFAESKLNQRRFALEMEVAASCLQRLSGEPFPVLLIDGSFILSFIGRMHPKGREAYLEALFALLDASERRRIPVAGYIDLSFAADICRLLESSFDLPGGPVFDALVLAERMEWFDRTAAFQCARGDVMPFYRSAARDYSAELCFVYIKTGQERLPARIDFPRWVLDAGLMDRVLDVVRAELVVGNGYPYALETADATAVLTAEDRIRFFQLFHEFARSSGLEMSLPGKSLSKLHRR